MTLYLALDSATPTASVAVGRSGAIAAEITIGGRRHAADLVPAAAECLRLAGAGWKDLTGIVVADGPGSFTGLRIGFATAAGVLRQRPELPLHTLPSLLSAAWVGSQLVGPGPVAALYDALRGEVFAAVYEFGTQVRALMAPCLTTLEALAASEERPLVAVGDGAAVYGERVRSWTGRDPVGPPVGGPRAGGLIELISSGLAARVDELSAWEPTYGRAAEAQVRWERTHGRALPGTAGG